jgi:hypothetical protein
MPLRSTQCLEIRLGDDDEGVPRSAGEAPHRPPGRTDRGRDRGSTTWAVRGPPESIGWLTKGSADDCNYLATDEAEHCLERLLVIRPRDPTGDPARAPVKTQWRPGQPGFNRTQPGENRIGMRYFAW